MAFFVADHTSGTLQVVAVAGRQLLLVSELQKGTESIFAHLGKSIRDERQMQKLLAFGVVIFRHGSKLDTKFEKA